MHDHGVYLGFDFGMKFIGIAVGQEITGTATAVGIIRAKYGVPEWQIIDDLVEKWDAQALIVGIPYQLDGSEQKISLAAREFADYLKKRYHLPVYLVDERLTTKAARLELEEHSASARQLERVDSYAAKLILESWLRSKKYS